MWCYIEKALVNILTDLKINKTRVISTGKLPLNVSLFENPNWLPYVIGNFAHSYLCRASLEKLGSILRRPVLSVRTTSILFWCPSDHQGRSGAQYLWQIELNYLLNGISLGSGENTLCQRVCVCSLRGMQELLSFYMCRKPSFTMSY